MNKENVIEIRCKKCNKLMMEYFVCSDDSAVALQNIGIKCDRCKRVMILKKYSEGMMKEHTIQGFEIQHSGLDEATGEKDCVMTWQHK